MEEELRQLIGKFNERAKTDERMQKELAGVDRSAVLSFTDEKTYKFYLRNQEIQDFGEGEIDEPDIRIITDTQTMRDMMSGELGPMKAFATKKLQVKAALEDIFRLRKLF